MTPLWESLVFRSKIIREKREREKRGREREREREKTSLMNSYD